MRFIWPLDDYYVTRDFDYESSIYIGGQHAAVDLVRLQGDTAGREIKAVADGVVVGDGYDSISGHHIILMHEDGWRSMYRHLAADAPPVVGQQIAQGQVIGNVGSTGMSTGPHLHFDLWHKERKDDTAFSKNGWWAHNPELYLGKEDSMAFTPEQVQEIRDIIFGHEFVGKSKEGNNISGSHNLVRWMGILVEHQDNAAKHTTGSGISAGEARVIAQEEDRRLKIGK
jgi:hypothetical protein